MTMKIDVLISVNELEWWLKDSQNDITNKNVVVIDTLRATSVIVAALSNKAKAVYPFRETKSCIDFKNTLSGEVLLGGERKGLKIEGFDLTNSPLDYKKEVIEGKNIIMSTSNGTKTLEMTKDAKETIVCALINVTSVAKYLSKKSEDLIIVCSGTQGKLSNDDFITAGMLVSKLYEEMKNSNKKEFDNLVLTDAAKLSKKSYEVMGLEFIKEAKHYSYLKSIGYDKDLEYCITSDTSDLVPIYKDGVIKGVKES